ncbi:MAG TPA: site-specific DNA-methyltransferase [Polyangiaceae bacterium]|nr:site-specific DNA-methyltransferase [Polyangiaceae bacterium]
MAARRASPKKAELRPGDCREVLPALEANSARLVYLDPPFFTQRVQRLTTRERGAGGGAAKTEYAFDDLWGSQSDYADFLHTCLTECKRVLAADGSLFFHCDRRAAHVARAVLDRVFGARQFRSEIIWHYRRWSNASRGLLPAHQTIYWYTKGSRYVFNPVYVEYSPATNVDQLLQRRTRDQRGKAVYERDDAGQVVSSGAKQGVPLGDVWDIPYLNPKAKERVGYPTQKPILLLERIIGLASNPGDLVLDPCCGSGTTLIAAELLGRRALGIDSSPAALALARRRLAKPVKTSSRLLEKGREAYRAEDVRLLAELGELELVPVQRNKGMDAILRQQYRERPVAVRVQRPGESLERAAELLRRAGRAKHCRLMVLLARDPQSAGSSAAWPENVLVIRSAGAQLEAELEQLRRRPA